MAGGGIPKGHDAIAAFAAVGRDSNVFGHAGNPLRGKFRAIWGFVPHFQPLEGNRKVIRTCYLRQMGATGFEPVTSTV